MLRKTGHSFFWLSQVYGQWTCYHHNLRSHKSNNILWSMVAFWTPRKWKSMSSKLALVSWEPLRLGSKCGMLRAILSRSLSKGPWKGWAPEKGWDHRGEADWSSQGGVRLTSKGFGLTGRSRCTAKFLWTSLALMGAVFPREFSQSACWARLTFLESLRSLWTAFNCFSRVCVRWWASASSSRSFNNYDCLHDSCS